MAQSAVPYASLMPERRRCRRSCTPRADSRRRCVGRGGDGRARRARWAGPGSGVRRSRRDVAELPVGAVVVLREQRIDAASSAANGTVHVA